MRDNILDAAERVVRTHGLAGLTVRAVADEAHYGKSTIHTIIGTKAELLEALADRITDRHIATLSALSGGPEDTSDGRYRCTAHLIIDEPHLSTAMFGRPRPADLVLWSKRWIATFTDELMSNVGEFDEVALAEALFLAHQQLAPLIPVITESGDPAFGARMLAETFASFNALARELAAQRHNTRQP